MNRTLLTSGHRGDECHAAVSGARPFMYCFCLLQVIAEGLCSAKEFGFDAETAVAAAAGPLSTSINGDKKVAEPAADDSKGNR